MSKGKPIKRAEAQKKLSVVGWEILHMFNQAYTPDEKYVIYKEGSRLKIKEVSQPNLPDCDSA